MDPTIKEMILDRHDSDDVCIAIRAAMKMAEIFREPFVILEDLRVVRLSQCNEPPLEIIRHDESNEWRFQ